MLARLGADIVVVLHLGFIVFVVLGGFLTWGWPKIIRVHVPVALWGVIVEIVPIWWPDAQLCPLTYLETHLRKVAGDVLYSGSFIGHYIEPIVYPPGITPQIHFWLAVALVLVNTVAYTVFFMRRRSA